VTRMPEKSRGSRFCAFYERLKRWQRPGSLLRAAAPRAHARASVRCRRRSIGNRATTRPAVPPGGTRFARCASATPPPASRVRVDDDHRCGSATLTSFGTPVHVSHPFSRRTSMQTLRRVAAVLTTLSSLVWESPASGPIRRRGHRLHRRRSSSRAQVLPVGESRRCSCSTRNELQQSWLCDYPGRRERRGTRRPHQRVPRHIHRGSAHLGRGEEQHRVTLGFADGKRWSRRQR